MAGNFMERSLAGYSPSGPRELDTTEGLNTYTHTHTHTKEVSDLVQPIACNH